MMQGQMEALLNDPKYFAKTCKRLEAVNDIIDVHYNELKDKVLMALFDEFYKQALDPK